MRRTRKSFRGRPYKNVLEVLYHHAKFIFLGHQIAVPTKDDIGLLAPFASLADWQYCIVYT